MTDEETRHGPRKFAILTAFATFVFVSIAILAASAAKDPVLARLRTLGPIDKGTIVVDGRPAECYWIHATLGTSIQLIHQAGTFYGSPGGIFTSQTGGILTSPSGDLGVTPGQRGGGGNPAAPDWTTVYDYRPPANLLQRIASFFHR